MPECRAVADDLIEVHLAANLFFEIELLLGELVFELGDFPICQGVFDGDGDLLCDVREQFHVVFGKRVFSSARDVECAQHPVMCDERNDAARPEPIIVRVLDLRGGKLLEIKIGLSEPVGEK